MNRYSTFVIPCMSSLFIGVTCAHAQCSSSAFVWRSAALLFKHTHRGARQLTMVNVKKRKGRVVIDSDSEDSASDDNLDQVGISFT